MKRFEFKKTSVLALVLSTLLALSACGGKNEKKVSSNLDVDLGKYPIQTEETLTYWCPLPSTISTVTDNLGETPYSQEYEKRTGIKVEYIHPAIGQETEAFNLMVASNELPDLVAYSWRWYNGGVSRAIEDEVLLPLNDLMEKQAPNYTKYLSEHPEYDKMVKTDDSKYPYFPTILDGKELTVTTGPAIRQDLLDKYNLKSPETIEDWTEVLRTFKKNGVEKPLSFVYGNVSILYNMFSATNSYYIDENDTIQFGMVQDSFKNALLGIKEWYDEGLLDKNIISVDSKMIDSYILTGKTAATITSGGSGIGKYMDAAPNDEFNLVGVMYPTKERGTPSKYMKLTGQHSGYGVGITTACKNPALAARFMDYSYSEEGHYLCNFGIEGVSYNMVNGYPTYTDLITRNPEGSSMSQMLSMYTQANNGRAFVQDVRYIEQYYGKEQQKIATREWAKGADLSRETFQIPYLTLTPEESERESQILNEIVSYANGMHVKFFTGVEPIEKFDEYVERIKKLGLDEILEIQNAAYKRYKNR